MSTHYNATAKTPAEHFANCEFQMANISCWFSAGELENARIKAECLRGDLNQLIAALKAQVKKEAL